MKIKKILFILVFLSLGIFVADSCFSSRSSTTGDKQTQSFSSKGPANETEISSTAAPLQEAKKAPPLELVQNESEFKQRFPGNWTFGRSLRGKIDYISGGNINFDVREKGQAAKLMTALSPTLGVPAEQLEEQKLNETTKTELSRVTEFKQMVDGLEVYNGQVTIHSRETDGAVFMINNDSKKVGDFNRVPRISAIKAQSVLESKYGSVEHLELKRGPVIFVSDEGATELAWVFEVKFGAPKFHGLEAVVGAETGFVLSETPTTVH